MIPNPPTRKEPSGRWLFDLSPQPIWLVRLRDMQLLEVNEAACSHFGYTRRQCRKLTLADLLTEGDMARFRKVAATSGRSLPELSGYRVRTSNGTFIDTDLSVNFITRKSGPMALIAPLDMTARKLLEDRLRQAGKMEALGMLAGGIAHDFNNLLTIISGYTQLLLHVAPEGTRQSLEQILKASIGAAQLTGQLLAFSRSQKLEVKPFELNKLVRGMSTMLRRLIGENIELLLELDRDAGAVTADQGQMEQVVMNLAVNARDAMAAGGVLTISTRRLEANDCVALRVTDTGQGMDPETAARVFDPFFTTKELGRGTGLGLSTVEGIVKQAGGRLALCSAVGSGTTVEVILPSAEGVAEIPQVDAAVGGGGETVLVVEDEEAVRKLVVAALNNKGYRVLVASSGEEALEVSRHEPGSINLMVTDVVMSGMDGVRLGEILHAERPGLRVLYMSGYTDGRLAGKGPLHEGEGYIQKPFIPSEIAQKVRSILDAAGDGSGRDKAVRSAGG